MPSYLKDAEAFGPEDFRTETAISADALERFKIYARLLAEWNKTINLVADSTLPYLWHRHFLDSAQLAPLILEPGCKLADIGSGAGFPGLVLAMMGLTNVTLVERDTRKAAFLRTVMGETGVKADILNIPAETVPGPFDVIVSRALAEVRELIIMSSNMRGAHTQFLLLKGKNLDQELQTAQKDFDWQAVRMRSLTDPDGAIVKLSEIRERL